MKRIVKLSIISCLVLSLFSISSSAQSDSKLGAIAVENGIFIYAGENIEKNGYYIIERKGEKDRQFSEITKLTTPNNLTETENRASIASSLFEHLIPLSNQDNIRVYEYVQAYKTDDSLYRAEHLPIIAIVAGTGFLDTQVDKGELYAYRITFFSDGNQISQEILKATKNTIITNLPIPKKFSSDIVNEAVFLEWIVSNQEDMSFFNVYRAYFGTNDFKKIETKKGYSNSDDGMHLIAVDASSEKSSLYKYYIQPVDIYGNISEMSEVITAGKLKAESILPITSLHVEELNDYQIKLSWKLDKSAIRSNIQVLRSDNFDDGFVEIMNLPPATTEFIDDLPQASENYYYYLLINGGSGQEFKSAKIAAMVKNNTEVLPEPKDVSGQSITNGIEITWRHDQPYTRGFYVYRATAENDRFNQISNLIPVHNAETYLFKDLDKNLKADEMYRYTVRAENDAYTLGKFSDTIHAFAGKKPIIEIPQKLKSIVRNGAVELYWDDMRESSKNVLGYKVFRKEGNNGELTWVQNDTLKPNLNYYTDNSVKNGQSYLYQVSAIDLFGQESSLSFATTVSIPDDSMEKIVPSRPSATKNSKGVTISWNQFASEDVGSIKIYRSEAGENAKAIKTVLINEVSYLDNSVKTGTLYYYKIAFINNEGKESKMSREISILY